jgi:nucleoside-diphosphate-sugar epimerase
VKVLVTGASSLLGAELARTLAARGDRVTVLQRRPAGLGLPEVLADVSDAAAVRAAVDGHEAVIHLAAKVNFTGPWSEYERINITGTAAVVAACRSAGVQRLVHVSSPSVAHAGAALVGVGAEPADPVRARGPYARSKAAAEQVALAADADGLAVVAVRPHVVWGPGDPQLVARVVARARAGRLPLFGSGAALVDSTYLSNAVDALVAALDRCEQARGQALVVTNGEPRPIADLLTGICAAAGAPLPSRHVPTRLALAAGTAVQTAWALRGRLGSELPADPPLTRFLVEQLSTAHWFDQRQTREALQWTPRVSVDEGLEELAAWFRAHPVAG